MSADPGDSRCPRCGAAFHCGIEDAAACPCTTLALDAGLLQTLSARFDGCLCLRCLQALAQGAELEGAALDSDAPFRPAPLRRNDGG
jgi:hypothetical protein